MHISPFDSPAVFPGKSIQIEIWQRSDARYVALIRERAEMSRPQSSYLQAKRMVLCQCSNVHVETFSENDSECTLEYSVLLAAASLDEAKDELCCILLLLEAETARLFPRILSA